MVDFKKLRASRVQPAVTKPVEIFQRLPKPPGINDLYVSQAQVLEAWYERRNERDLVIKLHTGGGKTLVALLIAQSILNEHHEPVIYLSPTLQLVRQVADKAQEYGIPSAVYEKGVDFPDDFLTGKSVLICTYQALFNARSRFGVRGGSREILHTAAVILDDAHVSFSAVRESFSLRVRRDQNPNGFFELTNLFRNEFNEIGKLGTFDDIVSGFDYGVLEVPYWSWQERSSQVREYLRPMADGAYPLVWPFLRDSFDHCHALISKDAFVITPLFPLTDLIPTFADCQRRIFLSATIGDDSAIVRTFDADHESIAQPISSTSVAGVSERMILAPELMRFPIGDTSKLLQTIAKWAVEKIDCSTVVLVPSAYAAAAWNDVACFADSPEKVAQYVKELQDGKSRGPFVFANRYDGIDLPGQACRILIVFGLPRGSSEYEQYLATTFLGGRSLNSALAQRIEQGIGRAARGAGDYCVVLISGKDLISWISRSSNMKFLTNSTRAQLEMGAEISKDIGDLKDLAGTIRRCLNRDKDWTEYHAETLAELAKPDDIDTSELRTANVERKAFQLLRDGYFEKAIGKIEKHCEKEENLDKKSKGWLLQFAARIAHYWGRGDLAQALQQMAYGNSRSLFRPQIALPYTPAARPGKQAEAIVSRIEDYGFRRGYLAEFEEVVSHLVPEATANQFEEALASLGAMLGFCTERPDNTYRVGPDVLWLLNDQYGLIIEAKSRKNKDNALTKEQHGQLLNAAEWFKKTYPSHNGIRVSVHPTVTATKSTITGDSKALTLTSLNGLIAEIRSLLTALCESLVPGNELIGRCEHLLTGSKLRPQAIVEHYLVPFEIEGD